MTEGVPEDCHPAYRRVVLRSPVQVRSARDDSLDDGVHVVNGQMQGDRGTTAGFGCLSLDLGVLVGHHPASSIECELHLPDPAVGITIGW